MPERENDCAGAASVRHFLSVEMDGRQRRVRIRTEDEGRAALAGHVQREREIHPDLAGQPDPGFRGEAAPLGCTIDGRDVELTRDASEVRAGRDALRRFLEQRAQERRVLGVMLWWGVFTPIDDDDAQRATARRGRGLHVAVEHRGALATCRNDETALVIAGNGAGEGYLGLGEGAQIFRDRVQGQCTAARNGNFSTIRASASRSSSARPCTTDSGKYCRASRKKRP